MLRDLQQSGSIEQDADLALMIYGDEYYNPETPDRGITEDSAAPSRSDGTLISALTDSGGSLNKFTDSDCKIGNKQYRRTS